MRLLSTPSRLGTTMLLAAAILLGSPGPAGHAADDPKECLPTNVFKNLRAGKKQAVIVYGTSLTAAAAWPKALKEYFDTQFPGQVTFVNAAKSGEESDWGLANLKGRVQSKKPDLVFIEFSVNDASTKHQISIEKSTANLDAMVKALREQNPQVDIVLQTMNTAWDSPDEPSHKTYASDRPRLAEYYDAYRQYAREHSLPLVDHFPNWQKLQSSDEEKFKKWLPEGLHPIPEASLAVTWPAIQALLEKARSAAGAP